MPDSPSDEITRLLQADPGTDGSADRLLELVYDQLWQIARQRMKGERVEHTLQATALVHEAYLRLVGTPNLGWANRAHFFSAAAEAMRRILIEHARSRGRVKRGGAGGRAKLPLSVVDLAVESDLEEILSVDEAVRRLEETDAELCQVVRLRFYAGLSEEETAQALGVSDRTIRRQWTLAKAWLRRELGMPRQES